MAYAAVISLKHTILRLKNPTINPKLTKSAYEKLELIEDVLKRLDGSINSSINRRVVYALDAEIREAVCKLQDAVESYVFYHHSLPPSDSLADNGVNQEIDLFLKVVKKLEEEYIRELDNPSPGEEDGAVSLSPIHDDFAGNKSTTIGLSDQLEKIINQFIDSQYQDRRITSLIGMAGIGKTHLAKEIYQHQLIVQHFDIRAWVSVGPTYQPKNILVDLVAQIEGKPRNLYMGEDMDKLLQILAKCLYHARYLIVLDDIWSYEILKIFLWDWLPSYGKGGRLLVTTRTLKAAGMAYGSYVHQISFLNNEESWNLLWQNVFAEEQSFPPQLEKVGRKIAELCEGLPLYILAVADVLRGHDKTERYWKKVADKKTTTFIDAYGKISKLLYSSYEYLPQHLKACFLYMGVFPQSYEISLPKLINLWIVEDFLETRWLDPLEDMAMRCMKELVSDSVVIICKQRTNYRIESSKLHSVYWYLCVEEARRSKFFHVLKNLTDASRDSVESQRRLSVQNNILFGIKEVYESMEAATLTARSLLFTGEDHQYPVRICLNLMLLKVLDALAIRFYEFPTEVLNLLQLRYLALTHNGELPRSISKLQQLQCLILRRHHNIKLLGDPTNYLPYPIYGARLPKLLTLYVNAESCTKDVFRSICNLRKLGIQIELHPDAAETLSCFQHVRLLDRLVSLKCVIVNPRLRPQVVAPPDHLSEIPWCLEMLSLDGLGYSSEYMSAIASLSQLKLLKLRCSAFQGPNWKVNHKEFQFLEYLLLEDLDLVLWTTDDGVCFPSLLHLIIRHCYKLKEIPSQIGAIESLKKIEVVDCSPSVVASALQIQQQNRNSSLQVVINSSWNLPR
ncbi:hypothetical protein C2S53_008035 [Perilla frutescens var. hirtella]|uniref:NB-ARC domain-containing protein n=1 Tax=Perilla frutescens var. hirtella TaxID=608512 RepID=A0AAD4J273_PERFH|nr:hypothetical protein C2S53_008035 [Perilla frutescens var. hirtella]